MNERIESARFIPTSTSAQRTLAEQALAILYERIMNGDLAPGSSLRLVELADELQMSPSPVREGLRRLETLGLVEIEAHKGARVREVSMADFVDTQQTRLALERLAIEAAAARFSATDAEQARTALSDHIAAVRAGDRIAARKAHTVFHFSLYHASGSTWLLRAIEPVWENSERYRFATAPDAQRTDESHLEHEAILDACERHDVPAALEAITAHIHSAGARMRSSLITRLESATGPSRPAYEETP